MAVEAIGIMAALALTALAGLTLLGFGIRNLLYGKQSFSRIIAVVAPLVVFGIMGFSGIAWANAGIIIALALVGLALLALLLSTIRGLLGI